MKKSITLVAALAAILTLNVGTANASTTTTSGNHAKHTKHARKASAKAMFQWFGTSVECDANGGARTVTRFFGINVGEGGTVPNSALCD